MMNKNTFLEIKEKYGEFSTWAIWDYENESDTKIIEENFQKLHTNWVFVGLNISKPVGVWGNFRGGKHDRKIKFAFNNTSIFGAYMTDLIKKDEKSSTEILKGIKQGSLDLSEHVKIFVEELKFVGVNEKSKFILFGDAARKIYDEFYEKYFPDNKVYYLNHYSDYSRKDQKWVENVWERLTINLDFDTERKKYKSEKANA